MPNDGDQVKVHYRGTLDDGTQFDTSRGGDPLEFEVGAGQLIPGFEAAVRDLAVGESATFRLEPQDAYGEPDPSLVVQVPAAAAPDGLAVGDRVMLGDGVPATVVAVTDQAVTVDANHPLAGQALTFEVELVAVEPAGTRQGPA